MTHAQHYCGIAVFRTLVALLLIGPFTVAAPVPKELKAKPPTLDGRWRTIERIACGLDLSDKLPMEWEVSGETLSLFKRTEKGTFDIPSTARVTLRRPEGGGADEIDYVLGSGKIRQLFKGRIAWVRGELLLAFGEVGEERPAEAKAGPTVSFYRLKRVSDR